MSEETLNRFMERLGSDEAFRERMANDWQDAIDELDLSPAELAALSTQDEDALRRLAGADVTGFLQNVGGGGLGFYTTNLICSWLCITTIDTPGSKRDCGTGPRGCGGGDDVYAR